MGKWFGISDTDLLTVLPNLVSWNASQRKLGFIGSASRRRGVLWPLSAAALRTELELAFRRTPMADRNLDFDQRLGELIEGRQQAGLHQRHGDGRRSHRRHRDGVSIASRARQRGPTGHVGELQLYEIVEKALAKARAVSSDAWSSRRWPCAMALAVL